MSTPHDSILRRCAFDEIRATGEAIAARPDKDAYDTISQHIRRSRVLGARWQHAQTEPILRALLAECERLRSVLEYAEGQLLHAKYERAATEVRTTLTAHEAEMRRLGGAE